MRGSGLRTPPRNQAPKAKLPGVLAAYDPAELAALCTAVDPHHLSGMSRPSSPPGRGNQPSRSSPRSSSTTQSPSSQAFRTRFRSRFSGRTAAGRRTLPPNLDKTLNLLKHIEPELREVLAFELARSSLAANDLSDAMAEWRNEPDTEVRRIAFIGLIQAISVTSKPTTA